MVKKQTKIRKAQLKVKPVTKKEGWVLRVPATVAGEKFISQMQTYLNTDSYSLRRRYTGPRPTNETAHTLKKDAKSIRLYLRIKGTVHNQTLASPDILDTLDSFYEQRKENLSMASTLGKIRNALGL